jgi:hypothetical protein
MDGMDQKVLTIFPKSFTAASSVAPLFLSNILYALLFHQLLYSFIHVEDFLYNVLYFMFCCFIN